jgi:hypothetical protein
MPHTPRQAGGLLAFEERLDSRVVNQRDQGRKLLFLSARRRQLHVAIHPEFGIARRADLVVSGLMVFVVLDGLEVFCF